jgi:uncharacterized lipoprotein YddW (UPF0748 family)
VGYPEAGGDGEQAVVRGFFCSWKPLCGVAACLAGGSALWHAGAPGAAVALRSAAESRDSLDIEVPAPPREFRAAWVATVANIDWPSKPGLTTEEQKAELTALLDRAAAMRLNAIILQARPACDALYDSKLEPWSEYLSGQQGKAPEPYYDPLQFAVEEAHRRGLELHAWFNPYRAKHPTAKSALAPSHLAHTRPELVKSYGRLLWLDPGEKAVQDHSLSVMLDVVKRYDLDGIHIDDYFYPYKEKDASGNIVPFPDEPSWQKYRQSGGRASRDDWRRSNVDRFIERIYRETKKAKPWVKFGISPFGIGRPGDPAQIKGFDQYTELYADARKWLRNGWCDYYTPQLYWKIDPPAQSYPVLLKWWVSQNGKRRHIWPGNFTSQLFDSGWPPEEILNQVRLTRTQPGATGNVHFSMKAFLRNSAGIAETLTRDLYRQQALVPASRWLDGEPPARPEIEARRDADGAIRASWKAQGSEPAWLWVLQTRAGQDWSTQIVPGHEVERVLLAAPGGATPDVVALSAVDRCGNQSKPAVVRL